MIIQCKISNTMILPSDTIPVTWFEHFFEHKSWGFCAYEGKWMPSKNHKFEIQIWAQRARVTTGIDI